MGDKDDNDIAEMSVADYIRWRSGGDDTNIGRSGLAFTDDEEKRVRSQWYDQWISPVSVP